MKTLPKIATEMGLHVLAYNLTRVMNVVGINPLLAAIQVSKVVWTWTPTGSVQPFWGGKTFPRGLDSKRRLASSNAALRMPGSPTGLR